MLLNHRNAFAIVAIAGIASVVRADLPAALDLIPADVAIVGGVENLERFQTHMADFRKATGGDAPNKDLIKLEALFQMPGMNRTGSAAIAIIGDFPEEKAAPDAPPGAKHGRPDMKDLPMVVLAPVSDYKLLVTAMGGDPAAAVSEIKGQQNSWFVKDSGKGYVIASPKKELTESFQLAPGSLEKYKKALGPVGGRTAASGDFIVIANIPKLADRIKSGMKDATKQLDMVASMQGAEAPNMSALNTLADTFTRDAQVSVLSVSIGTDGLSFDVASQFKDGSETAQMFQDKGNTKALTGVLPSKPFLFALAADTSSAGWKKIAKGIMSMQNQKNPGKDAAGFTNLFCQQMDSIDGFAAVVGYPKAGLAAGLFSETVIYVKTKDVPAYQKATGEVMTKMNGTVEGPNKFISTYAPGAATISDIKMDGWTMDMQPADPAAGDGGMGMVKGFLTGPSGKFQGYAGPVAGGLIMTYTQYEPAVAEVIKTAKEGNGLSKTLESAAKDLPADRSMEMYIGTKSVLETVSSLMGMFGQPPIQVPAEVAPVAMGAVGGSGGVQFRTVVPSSVFKAFGEFSKTMKGGVEDPMDEEPADSKGEKKDDKPKSEKPKF